MGNGPAINPRAHIWIWSDPILGEVKSSFHWLLLMMTGRVESVETGGDRRELSISTGDCGWTSSQAKNVDELRGHAGTSLSTPDGLPRS